MNRGSYFFDISYEIYEAAMSSFINEAMWSFINKAMRSFIN